MKQTFEDGTTLNSDDYKKNHFKRKVPLLRRMPIAKPKEFEMGVFDIETNGLGGDFIVGCACTEIGQYEYFPTVGALMKWILSNPGYILYAHNGAKFDFLYLAPYIMELRLTYHITVIRQGEKIIGFTLEDKEIYDERVATATSNTIKRGGKASTNFRAHGPTAIQLRDSIPLLNSDLYRATVSFAPEYTKLKGDIDFEGGEIFDPSNEKHMNYLRRDCDGLLAVMRNFYVLCYEMFSIHPSWTAGGTAMKAWKVTIEKGETYAENNSLVKENFIREAYYGGYVFPGNDTKEHTNVKSVDFNAAYAASMLLGVPYGNGTWSRTFISKPGFWLVRVEAPDDLLFPCIGKHTDKGLLWPIGRFTTYCTTEEIEYATSKGYTFEVIEGLYFEKLVYPFNAFVAICQKIEKTIDPSTGKVDPARKNIAKQLRNSLYGKFCMKREMVTIIIADVMPDGATPLFIPGTLTPAEGMFAMVEENDADYLIPAWGAYITMNQRLRLFKGMDACKTPFYCDTDSIKAPAQHVDEAVANGILEIHPTTYGCVKDEGTFVTFQALAPKTYHGTMSNGHHEMKAKGAPARELKKAKECPLCQADKGIYHALFFSSGHSLERTLRDSMSPMFEERHRKVSNIENSYGWKIDKRTQKIRPVCLAEW